jgi:predicted ArsR family transcriptional regulator
MYMRPTTRLRILEYLRKQQTASVRELSRALLMTGANIRHHLAVLESNNLIEFVSQRQEGRGRPENIYGLSHRMLGDGLGDLAGAMFTAWLLIMPDEAREEGLRSVARELGGERLPSSDISIPVRLSRSMDRLNDLHYQARWEAGVAGPHMILGRCPYSSIVTSYPDLCRMDAFLIEQQIGLPVKQMAKLQTSIKGLPYCTFQVTTNL